MYNINFPSFLGKGNDNKMCWKDDVFCQEDQMNKYHKILPAY